MKIAVASDHAAMDLRHAICEELTAQGIEYEDFGTHDKESCDYADYAHLVAKAVASGKFTRGIVVCGTGIGVSIAANKTQGIRAALCNDPYCAEKSREHNDANVLCMGSRVVGRGMAMMILNKWLHTPFAGGRHVERVRKLENRC